MISAIFIFKTIPRKLQNTDRTGQNEPFGNEMVMVSAICHIFLVILFSKQNHPLELQNTIPYIKFGFFYVCIVPALINFFRVHILCSSFRNISSFSVYCLRHKLWTISIHFKTSKMMTVIFCIIILENIIRPCNLMLNMVFVGENNLDNN